MDEGLDDALAEDAWRLDLASYGETVSKGRWKVWAWIRYVADIITEAVLQGDGRIIVNAPPQFGKSELISHWTPTWFMDLFPQKRVILTSYADSLATSFGRKVRNEFEANELCYTRPSKDSTAADDWATTQGGGMLCAGMRGSIPGRGGDLIIVDDPHKGWVEAQSPVQRQAVIDTFNGSIYTRRQPGTTIIVLQTRWHEADLTGYLLKHHADTWRHVKLPALAKKDDPLGRPEGESLCPERFTKEQVGAARAIGSAMFAGLYQQEPSVEGGDIIKRDWIRYYETPPEKFDRMWQSWDLTFDKTEEGSYVVGQLWGQVGANCYLVNQVRDRWDFVESISKVKAMSAACPEALEKKVEKKANGAALLSTLRDTIPGLIPVEPKGDKATRLRAVSPLFEAGNVWVPSPETAPWVGDWVEELVQGPLKAEHDDQCDTTSQALVDVQRQRILDAFTIDASVGAQASNWNPFGSGSPDPTRSPRDDLLI